MGPEGNTGKPLRLIVSGGIGSGKSTVLRILGELGIIVIEADRIGHYVLDPGGPAFAEVAATWPAAVFDGAIDRRVLASIVFSDPEQLRRLESMTHPHISNVILSRVEALPAADIAVELPLATGILDEGWLRVVVDVSEDVRFQRAVDRGFESEDVTRRMSVQPRRSEWLAAADYVIDNSGSLVDLEQRVEEMLRRLRTVA